MILGKNVFFEGLIQRMAETHSTNALSFDGITPAQIVAREILDYATNNVNIFWRKLSDPILDNDLIIEGVEEALARGVSFSVFSQRENSYITEMEILLYSYRMPVKQMRFLGKSDCNLMSCDNSAYFSWRGLKGIGDTCFNDPLTATAIQSKYGVIRQ